MTRALLVLMLAVAATGCGVRGPLYLPEPTPAEEAPAAGADEPQEEPQEEETGDGGGARR